jgi:hypothetical protein
VTARPPIADIAAEKDRALKKGEALEHGIVPSSGNAAGLGLMVGFSDEGPLMSLAGAGT